jgi:hypothetical protein
LVVGDDVTQQSAAAALAAALNEHEASRDGGGRAVFLAEGERVTATSDASGISAAYAIASAPDEFVSPPREPGMRLPKRRATPLQAIALLAMVGGLAVPPRRYR